MMKKVIVFGAGGSIGTRIVFDLMKGGYQVVTPTRSCDVTERGTLDHYIDLNITDNDRFDNVVYTVGHCPAGGFEEEIKYPLSEMNMDKYWNEIKMHQIGPLNVFQTMLKNLVNDGSFVFISSAITRVPEFPPFMHPYHHVSVIAAEDKLIKGMRHDPIVKERKIKIHRIAPCAVDTPFHNGENKPPQMVSIEEVAKAVVEAVQGDEEVDRQILPQTLRFR